MVPSERFPFLETEEGLRYCGGDPEFFEELVRVFTEDTDPQKIQELFDTKDWTNYRIAVHSLKNTSKLIGAVKLSEKAKRMEFAARDGDEETLCANQTDLMESLAELMRQLREALAQ